MHKTLILVVMAMPLNLAVVYATKEVKAVMVVIARSATKNIEKLKSELASLIGSNVYALIYVQLEEVIQEVEDLKFKLVASKRLLKAARKDICINLLKIQDLERVNSNLRSFRM